MSVYKFLSSFNHFPISSPVPWKIYKKEGKRLFPCRYPLTSRRQFQNWLEVTNKIVRLLPFGSFLELVRVRNFLAGSSQEMFFLERVCSQHMLPCKFCFVFLRIYIFITFVLFIYINGLIHLQEWSRAGLRGSISKFLCAEEG